MTSNLSSVIDTASMTYTIPNFKRVTSYKWLTEFCAVNNKELKFKLGFHPKPELYPTGVIICLWNDKADEPMDLEYEVSILNERKEKCYTKHYQFNYDKYFYQFRNVTSYILYDELIRESNGFMSDNQLTLFCEVKILKAESSLFLGKSVNTNLLSKMSDDIHSLLTNGEHGDFVLSVGGKEFRVHKNILAVRSSVFKAMFRADLDEKKQNRVEIIDVDLEVFEQLLSYIYSGTVDKLDEYALELFVAADKYQLEHLKSICAQFLGSTLTVDTVTNILVLSDMHSAPELKAKCIKFITANSTKVMPTDGWKEMMKVIRRELLAELYEDIAQAHSALL